MANKIAWERGPFERCPACQRVTFGILSAGGDRIEMRCTECRYGHDEALPPVDKRVLYLDQNAFSVLFAVESGTRLPTRHEEFTREMHRLLRRVVLIQQAILPTSDIHRDETLVFHDASGLRQAYERLGGDASFLDVRSVELLQILEYARAYINGREPALDFSVDEVLKDKRNIWLPDMRVVLDVDYCRFAPQLRQTRDRGHEDLLALMERWRKERPSFSAVRKHELYCFADVRKSSLVKAVDELVESASGDDPMAIFEATHHWVLEEQRMLRGAFIDAGFNPKDAPREVIRFWEWKRNAEIPHNRISANLFAGLARRVIGGQRRVTRGFMNDVRAISTYAPYVDAMFVDRECAEMLREGGLNELQYKARIFSFADTDSFLAYLQEIEAQATDEVLMAAQRIYGMKSEER